MDKLRKMLMDELGEIANKDKMSAGDLDEVYKITCTIKCLDKIMMVEKIKEQHG